MTDTRSVAPFQTGDRVKFSGYVIREKRDYWLNQGREPMKTGAKTALDEAIAARGTVQFCSPGQYAPWIVCVLMDGAKVSRHSLPHLYELSKD